MSIYNIPDDNQADIWRDKLIIKKNGGPTKCAENAYQTLTLSEAWRGRLRFNEFSNKVEFGGRAWDDDMTAAAERWFDRHAIDTSPRLIYAASRLVAKDQSYHPVREYLQGLRWDGVPRLDTWLTDYANASPVEGPYLALVGSRWLISAVARVMSPGCQADYMPVFEGTQGLGKTSLFRALFGTDWFLDHLPPMTSKDAQQAVMGKWCVLLDEMEKWSKAEHGDAKQFITRREETLRLPYGREPMTYPRQCVFAGTINPIDGYLTDPTGNRRYWPVEIGGRIEIAKIGSVRDQLWAEAYRVYSLGEVWYFDEAIARPQQEARMKEDPWASHVEKYVKSKIDRQFNELAHSIRCRLACATKGGDEAVGFA